MTNNKYFPFLLNIVLLLVSIYLFSKINYIFAPIEIISKVLLTPVVISVFIYYILRPLVRKLEHPKLNKGISVLLAITLFCFLISFFFIKFGAIIRHQFESSFLAYINTFFYNYSYLINSNLGTLFQDYGFEITKNTIDTLKDALLNISGNIIGLFSQIGNFGAQLVLIPFILFYLLKEDELFGRNFLSIIPKKYRGTVEEIGKEMDDGLSTYISGQLLVALILGILMYIGYLIIGLPNAILMGFFATITSIIPLLGAFLGILPALLIALTIDFSMFIKVIVVAIVVQQIEGNLITPNIIGNKLHVHPLGVIFIVIISVSLLGFLGAFIGLPLYVVIVVLAKGLYKLYKKVHEDKQQPPHCK